MVKVFKSVLFILYLITGLYLLNSAFTFLTIPEIISQYDYLIEIIGGVLLVFGGIKYFFTDKAKVTI